MFVCFRSSSSLKSGLWQLSNFAPARFTLTWPTADVNDDDDFPSFLKGRTCTYPTSEHAYQATKAMDLQTAMAFEDGGLVSMEAFKRWPVRSGVVKDMYAKKIKHWGQKAPGIVAKMVTTLKPRLLVKQAFGLEFKPAGTVTKRKYWKCILQAKFEQNPAAKQLLLKTAPATLVEQARFPRASNYWDASIDKDGKTLIGRNVMGRMVQHIRDSMLSCKIKTPDVSRVSCVVISRWCITHAYMKSIQRPRCPCPLLHYAIPLLVILSCCMLWNHQQNLLVAQQILSPVPFYHALPNRSTIDSTMAVASLFTGNHDSKGHFLAQSACKLARQIHRLLDVHLVLLMTMDPSLSTTMPLELKLCGWRDQRLVQPLNGPSTSPYYTHAHVFTKLHLWNLLDFVKILYLDLDTLPIAPFHSLFALPLHGQVGMVNDMGLALAPDDGLGPFNAGVIVLHPDAVLFRSLLDNITVLHYDFSLAEQSYLNAFFAGQITALPSTYNAMLSHRDIWPSKVTIVHYTWIKPWEAWSCYWNGVGDMAAVWNMA